MQQNLNKVLIILVYCLGVTYYTFSQENDQQPNTTTLKLEEAILLTLENNELIKIANTNTEIADIATHIGQAGLLPTIYLAGTQSGSISNSTTKFAGNNPEIALPDASRLLSNATLNIKYNLYNGGAKYYLNKKNTNNSFLKFWEAKQQKENVIMTVVNQYLETVRSQLLLDILTKTLELSQERMKIADLKYNTGAFDRLTLLNAEIVKNADSIALINQQLNYKNAKRNLERLTGGDLSNKTVDTNIGIRQNLEYGELESMVIKNNTEMKINEVNNLQSQLNLKIEKAKYLPSLDLTGDYGYRNQAQTGSFVTGTETIGWNLGLSLNYTLFDGTKRRIARKQAELRIKNVEMKSEYDKKSIMINFDNQYEKYKAKLIQLSLEEKNQIKAQLNYDRSKNAFETGSIDGTALREAQLSVSQSNANIVNVLIEAKKAEMNLYQLTDQLVEN